MRTAARLGGLLGLTVALGAACTPGAVNPLAQIAHESAGAAPSSRTAAATAQPTHVVPPTIDATGTEDVTNELNAYIASVPDGATVHFPPGAVYRIERTVAIEDRHGLVFEGNGALLRTTGEGNLWRRSIAIEGGSDITVRNLSVKGAHPNAGAVPNAYRPEKAGQHGFSLKSVDGVELDNVTVTDTYGDFVYLGRRSGGPWSDDVWIHDSTFDRSGRQGIALVAARNVVIERNAISGVGRSTIDLEPHAGAGIEHVRISDNEIGSGNLRFVAAHGSARVDHVTISRNRLVRRPLSIDVKPPNGQRRANWVITDNRGGTIYASTSRSPVILHRVDGIVFTGNHQRFKPGRDGVGMRTFGACDVTAHGNDLPGAVAEVEVNGTCPG